jgi:hypothetical protein
MMLKRLGIAFTSTGFFLLCFISHPLFAAIILDDVMSQDEQKLTGVAKLNASEKQALEMWLNKNFILRETKQNPKQKEVYLSLNIDNGKRVLLSDNSLYEIAPSDVVTTSAWITPFPIKITQSDDPEYPYKLTNTYSGSSVKAKLIKPSSS